jgi:hypothetical protein
MHRRHLSLIVLVAVVVAAVPMFGAHSWGTYHWRRTTAQVTPPVTMNLTAPWDQYASRVMQDWNASQYIESPWSFGSISTRKRCTSTTGQIEVCNSTYGNNGWLGIAGISLSGGHIVKGYTKLNDTYYNTAKYNTPAWRRMVFCQEVGHDYGLGHVNETFTDLNTGSCMDYTNDPSGNAGTNGTLSNEYPNSHDYAQLALIYGHTDALIELPFDAITNDATRPKSVEEYMADAGQWGTPIAFDPQGRPTVFFQKASPNHGGNHHPADGDYVDIFWAPEPIDDEGDRPNGPAGGTRQ